MSDKYGLIPLRDYFDKSLHDLSMKICRGARRIFMIARERQEAVLEKCGSNAIIYIY